MCQPSVAGFGLPSKSLLLSSEFQYEPSPDPAELIPHLFFHYLTGSLPCAMPGADKVDSCLKDQTLFMGKVIGNEAARRFPVHILSPSDMLESIRAVRDQICTITQLAVPRHYLYPFFTSGKDIPRYADILFNKNFLLSSCLLVFSIHLKQVPQKRFFIFLRYI